MESYNDIILSDEQKKAMESTSKNTLVISPPGSGKTRLIVERTAHLIEHQKVSPHELVLMTFTRLAAKEMRKRLIERIGPQANKIQIGTFHATALNLLGRFGEIIGLKPKNLTVYGEFEENFLLKEIAKEMGIFKKSWNPPKRNIEKLFADYYERGQAPEKNGSKAVDLFYTFIARCRENNSMTYSGLLVGFKLLIPKISKYLNWRHIIIDECQDNSYSQWSIIEQLQEALDTTLYCVTDTDQALYHWRGADVYYLIRNQSKFNIYYLTVNYRSKPGIVDAANRLISYNRDRIEKTMRAKKEEPCIK